MLRQDHARPELLLLAFWARRHQSNTDDVQGAMIYRFQDFELDEARLELRKDGVDVAIQARVLRALLYLVKHRERVVPKDELCDAVWQDIVVSDAALAQVVMHARKALGDEGEQQTLLKTVRGRGFRFVAEVQESVAASDSGPAGASAGPSLSPPHPPLIGREAELRALLAFVAAAQEGRGLCVLVSGEPGIGKTSLVEALAAEARARAVDVAWGKAWEDGGAPPFWPFIQVLRALVERHGLETLQRASGPHWSELAGLSAEAPGSAASVPADSATNRFRLFDAMLRLLRALSVGHHAQARPQLIVLEDLHACDDASLSMLRYLGRELSGARLMIVGTFRDLALGQQPALRALADSVPANQRIQLTALPQHESDLLLAKSLSEPPSPRLAAAVYELSGGNPLCIAELGRQAAQGNLPLLTQASALSHAVPERVAHAVRLQLSTLPEPTVQALVSASALGRSFVLPLLAQLLGVSELELLERLSPALACGLLRACGNAGAELSFAHALMRGAVYAELASHRRAQLHQQIAELLEQRAEPALLPLHELAHHYHLAAPSGGRQKAIEFAVRAADHALAMRAYETAAELQERAFALSTLEGAPAQALLLRAFSAGAACYTSGQLQQAVHYFDRAAEIARQQKAYVVAAEAVGAACFVLRGTILFDRPRQQQMRDALKALPEGDSAIKAMLLPASTYGDSAPGALAQRRAAANAGTAMARRLGEPHVLARTLSTCHLALWGAAHPREQLEISNELVDLARSLCDGEMMLDALLWRISCSIELGDDDALAAASTEYLSLLDGHHSGWHRYMAAILQCVQITCYGDFVRAEALSLRALEIGKQQHEPSAQAFFAVRQLFGWLDGRSSDQAGTAIQLDPPSDLPAGYDELWVLAWVRCGRERQARAALAAARARGFASLPLDPLRRPILALYAMCAAELSERQSAAELYDVMREHDGLHVVLQSGVYLGPISYYLGVLAAALDRPSAAAQHYESALTACQVMRSRCSLWKVQQSYAELLITQARSKRDGASHPEARAAQLLEHARSIADELGCDTWLSQTLELQHELKRLPPRLTQVAG